jgi:P4 family phage/plasmid primase-like protien
VVDDDFLARKCADLDLADDGTPLRPLEDLTDAGPAADPLLDGDVPFEYSDADYGSAEDRDATAKTRDIEAEEKAEAKASAAEERAIMEAARPMSANDRHVQTLFGVTGGLQLVKTPHHSRAGGCYANPKRKRDTEHDVKSRKLHGEANAFLREQKAAEKALGKKPAAKTPENIEEVTLDRDRRRHLRVFRVKPEQFPTQGQGKKAVDPEALALEQILALTADLTTGSAPEKIKTVLGKVVKAALDPVAKDQAIGAIRDRTRVRVNALKRELALIELKVGGDSHDKALALTNAVLANAFNGGKHLLRCADGSYWAFKERLWQSKSDAALCKLLMIEAAKTQPSCANMQQLVSNAKKTLDYTLGDDEDLMDFNADPLPVVNCANGEVWLDKDGKPELREHDPASRLTSCLPIAFDPSATCPILDQAMLDIFGKASDPPDMARHWYEAMGYAIQPRRDIPVFIVLIGHGANGKSKSLQTLQHLLGSAAVMNAPIANFQRDRFNIAALHGKLLFIDDDMGADTHLDDGLLKAISEAKEMSTRHAYGKRNFKFLCLALPIMAGNHYPTTSDNSHGLRRRAMVIPFDRQFGPGEADKELFPKIWDTELPGILNRALEGLARLRQRGDFKPPVDCVRAAQEFMAHANPLIAFIEDETVADPKGHTMLRDFREAMTLWATGQGMKKPVPYKALKRQLEGLGYEVKKVEGHNRVNGLALKS